MGILVYYTSISLVLVFRYPIVTKNIAIEFDDNKYENPRLIVYNFIINHTPKVKQINNFVIEK